MQYSPVVFCKRDELPFRIEIVQHLSHFDMDLQWIHDNVFFKDDLDTDLSGIESIGLVDFNEIPC